MTPPILKAYLASSSVLTRPVAVIWSGTPNVDTGAILTGIISGSPIGLPSLCFSLQEAIKVNAAMIMLNNCIFFMILFLLSGETGVGTFYGRIGYPGIVK